MKRRLITSALPYVNNVPHLGNLIQVLSADVFARFCRSRGYETLYVCGTDEYGTATETRARQEGVSPKELCDRYFAIHRDIYQWFNISFDKFGRTSEPEQTEIVQRIFRGVKEAGYITEHSIEQLYSEASDMFLPDRYVKGTCPHCDYDDARGDQCENCGKVLDPTDLIDPVSTVDGTKPVVKETKHLYIDLPKLLPKLQEWMKEASERGKWARNAVQMTNAWIRDGLKERAITRDLKWGIPVPAAGFENKVFYVWFDAPIGYISITAQLMKDWEKWWQSPEDTELFQFIGKDNIPFHTVIFPASLLASGEKWTMLHHMSSSEYLNYEAGKFSKSKGIGVFGNDVQDTGIEADVWRFYIFYNRPETSDYTFTWQDFMEKVNGELVGNFSNLVNRTLTFLSKNFDGKLVPVAADDQWGAKLWSQVEKHVQSITDKLEWAGLRDGIREVFEIGNIANKLFQDAEPWKLKDTDPSSTQLLLSHLVYLIRTMAVLLEPYIPASSKKLMAMIGAQDANWGNGIQLSGIDQIGTPEILFKSIPKDQIAALKDRFSGSQADREDAAKKKKKGKNVSDIQKSGEEQPKKKLSTLEKAQVEDEGMSLEERFKKRVTLKVAKITKVTQHPEAEKLYIEELDDGSGEERVIVSGLVPFYKAEELEGKHIILVDNLKPAKLRGVKSAGMLLAASRKDGETELCEVIEAPGVAPGTVVTVGDDKPAAEQKRLEVDIFFDMPLVAKGGKAFVGDSVLKAGGVELGTSQVLDGDIG